MIQWNHMHKLETINFWKLTCFIRSHSPKPLDRTLIYHYDTIKTVWLWPEKMQLVKINLFVSTPFTTVANMNSMLPGHRKMLINPRGMGEAALLPVCKTEFWFTTCLFSTLTELVVALFVGKTCCSTEGNQALVCLNRLTRLTQQDSQVQLLLDLLEQKIPVSIVFSYF